MASSAVLFTVANPEYYESLASVGEAAGLYRSMLSAFVPQDDWKIVSSGIWLWAAPRDVRLADAGYKIHVSAHRWNAEELLTLLAPVCVRIRVPFKVIKNPELLVAIDSKYAPRASAYKFVTMYPPNPETFKGLIEELHVKTRGMRCANILSDFPYYDAARGEQSRVLSWRYGGFVPRYRLRQDGTREFLIPGPDGGLWPDERRPFPALPTWVENPFGETVPPVTAAQEQALHTRFLIDKALAFSTAGGVYKARDLSNNESVVVKEGRPLTDLQARAETASHSGDRPQFSDAMDSLYREFTIIQKLAHLGYTPRPIQFFFECDHAYLVEELVPGITLMRFRAKVGFALGPFAGDRELAGRFTRDFMRISAQLIAAVRAIHDCGIILGDISPANVIIDPETLRTVIVDCESAWDKDSPSPNPRFADRFVPGLRLSNQPSENIDFFALGMTLYSLILPVVQWFEIAPDKRWPFLDRLLSSAGLPTQVGTTIRLLADGRAEEAEALVRDCNAENWRAPDAVERQLSRAPATHPTDFLRVTDLISEHMLRSYDARRRDRLWPPDYTAFETNPLSVAYGACGPLLFLKNLGQEIPQDVRNWLETQISRVDTRPVLVDDGLTFGCPPGLYVGLAGVAYALHAHCLEDEAEKVFRLAVGSPLALRDATFFHGMAGVGLVALDMHHATHRSVYRESAIEAGMHIVVSAMRSDKGFFWRNEMDGRIHFGLAYGSAGVALFLLNLFRETQDEQFLHYATGAINFDLDQRIAPGFRWVRWEGDNTTEPYWLHGAAGIASVLTRFAVALDSQEFLDAAKNAANSAFSRFTTLPGQFEGLSGIGERFLDLWSATQEAVYYDKAVQIAESVLAFGLERPDGYLFPGRSLRRWSTCFAYGSSGCGLFLRRLATRTRSRIFHDISIETTDCR